MSALALLRARPKPTDADIDSQITNIGVDNRILRNQWVKIAEYLKWESIPGMSKDGIWRAWVNGVLTMNYTDRTFPDLVGIAEFQFSMTRQMPVSLDERAWVDHTIVRGR